MVQKHETFLLIDGIYLQKCCIGIANIYLLGICTFSFPQSALGGTDSTSWLGAKHL